MPGCEVMPGNIEAEQPLEEFYALTEEQLLSMDDAARVAWALTRIQGLPETEVLDYEKLTGLIEKFSLLEGEARKDAVIDLVRNERVDREGFAGDARSMHLSLNEEGHKYLEGEVEKAKA
jgi:hypothetical protein